MCYNISLNLSGDGYDYMICTLSIDHSIDALKYAAKSKTPCKKNTEGNDNFLFPLTDENISPIEFGWAPTVIKLNMFNVNRNNSNFYVNITNNDLRNMFKDNPVSCFTTKLPK